MNLIGIIDKGSHLDIYWTGLIFCVFSIVAILHKCCKFHFLNPTLAPYKNTYLPYFLDKPQNYYSLQKYGLIFNVIADNYWQNDMRFVIVSSQVRVDSVKGNIGQTFYKQRTIFFLQYLFFLSTLPKQILLVKYLYIESIYCMLILLQMHYLQSQNRLRLTQIY